MTRARDLSKLSNSQVFSIDNNFNVGINSTVPAATLDVRGNSVITGVLTATSFSGTVDATGLTGSPSITVTDITASGNVSIAGTLTYEDVTNIDAVGVITARSDVSIADKIIHTGDTNTAIRFPAADTFTVETAGSERVRITSAGDVGIGTVTPRNISNFGSFAINGTSGAFADFVLNGTRTGTTAVDSNGFTCEAVGASTPFRVITNGSERLRVDSDGNMMIGVTSPSTSDSRLTLQQTGDHCEFNIVAGTTHGSVINMGDTDDYNDGRIKYDNNNRSLQFQTANAERLRIDSSGRILQGLTSAKTGFFNDNNAAPAHQIQGSTYYTTAFSIFRDGSGSSGPNFILAKGREAIVQNDDILGTFSFQGHDGTTELVEGAQIQSRVDGTPGSNDMPGRLMFLTTADGASAPTERMRIHSGGGMSLGATATPTALSQESAIRLGTSTLSHHTITNLSTTTTAITAAAGIGALAFVQLFNTSNGAQYVGLHQYRYGNLVTISETNNTGLTLNFSVSTNTLRLATSSGTVSGSVIALQSST
jgi:hypothetical protein